MSAPRDLVFLWGSDDQTAFYSRFHQTRGGSGGSSYYLPLFPGHSMKQRAEITSDSQLEVKAHSKLSPHQPEKEARGWLGNKLNTFSPLHTRQGQNPVTKQERKEISVSATSSGNSGLPLSRQSPRHRSQGVQSPSLEVFQNVWMEAGFSGGHGCATPTVGLDLKRSFPALKILGVCEFLSQQQGISAISACTDRFHLQMSPTRQWAWGTPAS